MLSRTTAVPDTHGKGLTSRTTTKKNHRRGSISAIQLCTRARTPPRTLVPLLGPSLCPASSCLEGYRTYQSFPRSPPLPSPFYRASSGRYNILRSYSSLRMQPRHQQQAHSNMHTTKLPSVTISICQIEDGESGAGGQKLITPNGIGKTTFARKRE